MYPHLDSRYTEIRRQLYTLMESIPWIHLWKRYLTGLKPRHSMHSLFSQYTLFTIHVHSQEILYFYISFWLLHTFTLRLVYWSLKLPHLLNKKLKEHFNYFMAVMIDITQFKRMHWINAKNVIQNIKRNTKRQLRGKNT